VVGQAINDALVSQFGFGGGAGTWQTACSAGLQVGAATVYTKIDSIDVVRARVWSHRCCEGVDSNKDSKVDTIQTGKWTGTLNYGGTPAPLAEGATFSGARM
jgi:hypothetical protein